MDVKVLAESPSFGRFLLLVITVFLPIASLTPPIVSVLAFRACIFSGRLRSRLLNSNFSSKARKASVSIFVPSISL